MGALSDLLKQPQTLANPANPAKQRPAAPPDSQGSQDSQGGNPETLARLLTLAECENYAPAVVQRLHADDVAACAGLPDATLRAYLHTLVRGRRMDAGQVPPEWGEPVTRVCEGCGPVLLWPTCPDPVKACPWCFRRQAGKPIPRPLVTCGDCRHYLPDTVNPAAGMGRCALGPRRAHWPMQRHRCADWGRAT